MATKTKPARKSTTTTSRAIKRSSTRARRTKVGVILNLLQRPAGASIAALTKATGWQPHSVRAALTGLRKKGLEVRGDKNSIGVTVYRATEA